MSLGFFETIKNSVVAYAATTDYAKSNYIRPKLEDVLKITEVELAKAKVKLTKIESLKAVPALEATLNDLTKAAEAVLEDARADATLVTLTNIIGNHVGDYDSIDAFKAAVPEMKSIKAMMNFGKSLIDLNNYEKLSTLLTELQAFSSLERPRQTTLLRDLEAKTLVTAIAVENGKLNINQIHQDVKKMVAEVCKELKLSDEESKALNKLFDALTDKHLLKLNTIRHALIEQLPAFLASEKVRVCKLHPELVVVEEKKSVSILDRFNKRKAQDAKTAPRGKQAPKTEVVAPDLKTEEAEVKEKPRGKCAPKKAKLNDHK